jgi:feruloyl-CoA synthase
LFATPAVSCRRDPDGTVVLRSLVPAGTPDPTILHWLRRWATETPHAPLLTVAGRAPWSYARAWDDVTRVAGALVDRGVRPG